METVVGHRSWTPLSLGTTVNSFSTSFGKLLTLTDTWISILITTRIAKLVLMRHLYIEPRIYQTPKLGQKKKIKRVHNFYRIEI